MRTDKIERSITLVGQVLILVGLVYAIWNYGGVTSRAKLYVAIGSAVAVGLACLSLLLRQNRNRIPIFLPALACLFIAFAGLQTLDLSWLLGSDHFLAKQNFAGQTIASLESAINDREQLTAQSSVAANAGMSVAPHRSQIALVPLCSAVAVMISVAVFFTTTKSRKWFAGTVVFNAVALVLWGFLQRAGHDEFLLPGIPHTVRSIPFASFIYKNAGAASLVPAIAILVGILFYRDTSRSRSRHRSSSEKANAREGYGGGNGLLDIDNLIKISLLFFLLAGLLISLSRGAWFAFAMAAVVGIALNRKRLPSRRQIAAAIASVVVVIALVWVGGGTQVTRNRINDLSVDRVTGDSRWRHWPDGWDMASAHFPFGAGYGTYRYAALPHQADVRPSWYQYAHNQYLETFAETGIIGLAILLVGIAWLVRHCFRLERQGYDTDHRRWGMIALIVVLCGAVQSVIDFVIVIPANFYLYAAVTGLALACLSNAKDRVDNPASDVVPRNRGIAMATGFILLMCLFSAKLAVDQRFADQTLTTNSTAGIDAAPESNRIEQAIAQIDLAIERQPNSAELYRRRSNWKLLAVRSAILDLASQSGLQVTWASTHPSQLFALLQSAGDEDRDSLLEDLWSEEAFAKPAVESMRDLSNALKLTPQIPGYHITAAYMAPVFGMPTDSMIHSLSPVANNSADLLYTGGLIAYLSGDLEMAVDFWHRSLELDLTHAESIYHLSSSRMPSDVIAEKLIPAERMYTVLRLLKDQKSPSESELNEDRYDSVEQQMVSAGLIDALNRRDDLDDAVRSVWIGNVHAKVGNIHHAVDAWSEAVKADRRNCNYRYQYAAGLTAIGHYQEAIDQASLGSAMGDEDERFGRLIRHLRHRISNHSPQIR